MGRARVAVGREGPHPARRGLASRSGRSAGRLEVPPPPGSSLLLRGPSCAPRPTRGRALPAGWAAGGRRRRCGCAPARWGRPEITSSPNAAEPAGLLGWLLLSPLLLLLLIF